MTDALKALTERRKQIKAQIKDNAEKFMLARFDGTSADELKALAKQGAELENELDAINADIQAAEQDKRNGEIRLQEEKRKTDEQARLEKERQRQEQAKAQWTDTHSKLKAQNRAEKIIDTLKVQVTPSTECIEPNDSFVKGLFRFGSDSFKNALQGKKFSNKESHKTSKQDAVFSSVGIQNAEGYENDNPLSEFDRAVLGVLISEYLASNRYTTVNIIFRALIGKIGDQNARPMKNQQDATVNSVVKLMGTIVDFSGVTESLTELKYTDKDGNTLTLKFANLISADILDAKINGQIMEGVIFFKDNSPLFKIADIKNQVIRYPHELLNVPNQNNTPRIIAVKKYVMRRICEIKLHKMTPTITFDDVFKRCRMSNCSRDVKMDARNAVIKLFTHLQEKNFISSFEPVQQRGKFISVKFTF